MSVRSLLHQVRAWRAMLARVMMLCVLMNNAMLAETNHLQQQENSIDASSEAHTQGVLEEGAHEGGETDMGAEEEVDSSFDGFDGFITPKEYGAKLYENPRGIGCVKCHGEHGEEHVLASYIHKGKTRHIIVPRINNLEFSIFRDALSRDSAIMPKYNLTDEEINAIYLYITSQDE